MFQDFHARCFLCCIECTWLHSSPDPIKSCGTPNVKFLLDQMYSSNVAPTSVNNWVVAIKIHLYPGGWKDLSPRCSTESLSCINFLELKFPFFLSEVLYYISGWVRHYILNIKRSKDQYTYVVHKKHKRLQQLYVLTQWPVGCCCPPTASGYKLQVSVVSSLLLFSYPSHVTHTFFEWIIHVVHRLGTHKTDLEQVLSLQDWDTWHDV